MTTFQQPTGSGGGGGDDQPTRRPEDEKDKEAVKDQVVTTSTNTVKEKIDVQPGQGTRVRVARGGFATQMLARGGIGVQKPTDESRSKRAEDAQQVEGVRQAARQSIEREFWGAVGRLGGFEYSPVSSGRHLRGGADPDEVTISFFEGTTAGAWLLTQPRGDVELHRTTDATRGDGISFRIYFRKDLDDDKRRSVMGHYRGGKLTIIHIGPIT